jgi:RNA-directed DNA polymerase
MAVLLVAGPIFEVDLFKWQYGFRTGVDAKMALRRIHFNTIPHGDLMRYVSRRIADDSVLAVIRHSLNAPVVERTPQGERRSTEAKDRHRGTPTGLAHLTIALKSVLPPVHAGLVRSWLR